MKKIIVIAIFSILSGISFAGGNQSELIKKFINRKVIFPSQLELKEPVTVEVQIEVSSDGCLAVTASSGDSAIVNYIAEKISSIKIPDYKGEKSVFIYRFTFQKENKENL